MKKILVVREDRIGDVVLSTPSFSFLHANGFQVEVLVNSAVEPILDGHPSLARSWARPPSFFSFVQALKVSKYDAVVFLQVQWLSALAAFFAQIPIRVGPRSKWYSFFLFNRGVLQNRSHSEKNEAKYNLDLAVKTAECLKKTKFLTDEFRATLSDVWGDLPVSFQGKRYVVIHPGMGGSALNWKLKHYSGIAAELSKIEISVVISGGTRDRPSIKEVFQSAVNLGALPKYLEIFESQELKSYLSILKNACVVLAPSTGPLHLASALGTPVVGIYPPILVQSTMRWSPYGVGEIKTFSPSVRCPEKYNCAGKSCSYYDCLDRISVNEVFEEVKRLAEVKHH